MSTRLSSLVLGGVLGLLAVPACDLDIPDLNNPGLDQLQDNPTPGNVNAAATGMLVGQRGSKSAATGLVNQLGILGRESYDFDANDGRFVTELIQGTLQKGSPFGGIFWAANYTNLRNGNVILHALEKLNVFDTAAKADAEKSAMRGYVHTLQAMEFLTLVITHYDTGEVIDVDHPLGAPLGAIAAKADVYKEINRLLELGQMELAAGGDSFTFPLSPGYAGFDDPPDFILVNRAIKAQVAVYIASASTDPTERMTNYTAALDALGASFLNDVPGSMGQPGGMTPFSFNTGPSYSYSTGAGDAVNGLFNRKSVFAHQSFLTDVVKDGTMKPIDARYTAKIKNLVGDDGKPTTVTSTNDDSLTTGLGFNMYTSAASPIPIIRNEELILLEAEALWFTGDHTMALDKLDVVRTGSGKLPAIDRSTVTDDASFVTALMYERRYSLMYEGGHRWIDLRRFGLPIPLDDPSHKVNLRFPIPQGECDARQNPPECSVKSTDPIKS
ncbi:MAG TPA: RagB/SusD family nutrient uptake outer membrane protein [Kofleriaceae bacterium]|jgi:hypothetical protein|nr:RagB/SusD family nutrient uptake outer membrane protein [Kofleriaceae bacterium]